MRRRKERGEEEDEERRGGREDGEGRKRIENWRRKEPLKT